MPEPAKNAKFQAGLCAASALTRKSKATPRRISPTSISATGRYSAVRIMPCAFGNAISRMPTPSTSQVSLASQKGPMLAIIVSLCGSSARCSSRPTPRS